MFILPPVQKHRFAMLLFGLFISFLSYGQTISNEELAKFSNWPRYGAMAQFYQLNSQRFAWLGRPDIQTDLLALLHHASMLGLNEADYQRSSLAVYQPGALLRSKMDSLEADVCYTDAALHFFVEASCGNSTPAFRYNGLSYKPELGSLPQILREHMLPGKLKELLNELQPKTKEYTDGLQRLISFQRIIANPDFHDAKIISGKADSTNNPLLLRLYQFGFLNAVDPLITKRELVQKIKLAQQLFDLLDDGVLRSTTLEAFNKPLAQRIEELKAFLNTLRWLNQIRQTASVLVLNLPSATFFVYEKGALQLFSKVIVGKPSTPTPTLTSTITEVVLYPYWMVPHKIATKELLPAIKKNIGYLEHGNYQVLNKQGRVLNPYSINWHSLSAGYFPYIIRQSTGCDNALGIVKFNFDNPFTVYLHDTPIKLLFSSTRRFYSHGCMRIDKPVELARYVLGFNRIAIDTLTAKGCLNHQTPLSVPVQRKLPVVVLYSTAWYNENGELHFYEDMYGRNKAIAVAVSASVEE
jgi:murein L,D-transpeptidase YcbB/YkuD